MEAPWQSWALRQLPSALAARRRALVRAGPPAGSGAGALQLPHSNIALRPGGVAACIQRRLRQAAGGRRGGGRSHSAVISQRASRPAGRQHAQQGPQQRPLGVAPCSGLGPRAWPGPPWAAWEHPVGHTPGAIWVTAPQSMSASARRARTCHAGPQLWWPDGPGQAGRRTRAALCSPFPSQPPQSFICCPWPPRSPSPPHPVPSPLPGPGCSVSVPSPPTPCTCPKPSLTPSPGTLIRHQQGELAEPSQQGEESKLT